MHDPQPGGIIRYCVSECAHLAYSGGFVRWGRTLTDAITGTRACPNSIYVFKLYSILIPVFTVMCLCRNLTFDVDLSVFWQIRWSLTGINEPKCFSKYSILCLMLFTTAPQLFHWYPFSPAIISSSVSFVQVQFTSIWDHFKDETKEHTPYLKLGENQCESGPRLSLLGPGVHCQNRVNCLSC